MTISFKSAGAGALTVRLAPSAQVGGKDLKPGDVRLDHSGGAVAIFGDDYGRSQLITLFAKAVSLCRREGYAQLTLELSALADSALLADAVYAAAYGTHLANYAFDRHLSQKADNRLTAVGLAGVAATPALEAALNEGEVLGRSTCLARDLNNTRSHQMTPMALAAEAQKLERLDRVSVEVLAEGDIEALKMGGLLGVSQGSYHPPAFIIMRYKGADSDKVIGLVGKGITYDSGGLSLKTHEGLITMHGDMGGAAATLAAFSAVAELGLAVNVTAVIPACENMLSSNAYRPGDIITQMSGKTVIIKSTDAEGRLILADAITWMAQKEKPACIIDIATLTGAAAAVAGPLVVPAAMAGGFSADALAGASAASGCATWPMPLPSEYMQYIKDDHADLANSTGGPVGMIGAALFLKAFTEDYPWLHLDIAGASHAKTATDLNPAGATGMGTALLCHLVKSL